MKAYILFCGCDVLANSSRSDGVCENGMGDPFTVVWMEGEDVVWMLAIFDVSDDRELDGSPGKEDVEDATDDDEP
jgi:hypothetical protein